MAIQIYEREYHVDSASETTGYDAFVADLTSWYDWDEIDTETIENATVFRKYQPGSTVRWCGLNVMKAVNAYGMAVYPTMYNGTSGYRSSSPIGGASNNRIQYAVCAVYDDGMMVEASLSTIPTTSTNIAYTYIGMCKSANGITGTSGVCSIGATNNSNFYIGGDSTVSTSFSSLRSPVQSTSGLVTAAPLVSQYCADVPDGLLIMTLQPDSLSTCNIPVTYGGKAYRRLGRILIPE